MKTKLVAVFLLAASSMFAAHFAVGFGIGVGPFYGPGYVVAAPPPPAPYVAPGYVAPGYVPGYSWIGGYYYPAGTGWAWRAGYWARPPYAGGYWVAPRYYGGRYYAGYWHRR